MVSEGTRYAREVDGLTLPVPLGGHPALDFCNTAAGWGEPVRKEYLRTYAHLVVWAREAGLLDPEAAARLRDADGAAVLRRALALRDSLYAVLRDGERGAAWETVAREAERAAAASRLTPYGWRLAEGAGVSLPVLAAARAGGELVVSPEAARVRACPGRGCGWLFLDPRGRRRWCDMAVCGNREKARRHAARARAASA